MGALIACFHFLRVLLRTRASIAAENLAMRQQLAIYHREKPKPSICLRDRLFWVLLCPFFSGWKAWVIVVKPETVVRWHRAGFRLYWRWKSRGKPGRPQIPRKVIALIQRIAKENVTWGAPRIRAELHLLGHDIAEATVAKYMPRRSGPPSQTWKTFLKNHVGLVSIDFFVVPTATFHLIYGFLIFAHDRRRVLHYNTTTDPSPAWVCQQFREAFPFDTAPDYLIRDRDGSYGEEVSRCLEAMGVEEVITAPRSPWQNPFVERLIGTLRRELLDHVIVVNQAHLMHLLDEYFLTYYHTSRTHRSLDQNSPNPRAVEPSEQGEVISIPLVGGLHHRYTRAA